MDGVTHKICANRMKKTSMKTGRSGNSERRQNNKKLWQIPMTTLVASGVSMGSLAGGSLAGVGSKRVTRDGATGWRVSLMNPTKETPAVTVSNEYHLKCALEYKSDDTGVKRARVLVDIQLAMQEQHGKNANEKYERSMRHLID
jgi:hypothetical protein